MKNNIVGYECRCGEEVSFLSELHPYSWSDDFSLELTCPKCKQAHTIDKTEAINFNAHKAHQLFDGIYGNVLEIGCEYGLLTNYISKNEKVNSITCVDIEDYLKSRLLKSKKTKFVLADLEKLDTKKLDKKYDFLVCKDVLMCIMDIEKLVEKLSKICENVLILNWFNKESKNCKNKNATPMKVKNIFAKYYQNIKLSYPHIYNYCYLISASKK
ncbi:MAG: class I SAM-dependent methyltransferase [Clostridia bacterium]|nr:class I SAM-dependent methyltransferase [Clostridia bacterium]